MPTWAEPMGAGNLSMFGRAAAAQIRPDPFPHLVITDALEPTLYQQLADHWPPAASIARQDRVNNNTIYLRTARSGLGADDIAPIWQEFFAWHTSPAFLHDAMRVWAESLRAEYPHLEDNFGKSLDAFSVGLRQPGKRSNQQNRTADAMLDCVFGIHSPVSRVSAARDPHVDSLAKMFSALLYFRTPEDDCSGGDFELFRCPRMPFPQSSYKRIPERLVEHVRTVPYAPNTMVSWLNSARAIHAVSPRSITARERRYIAVTAECYAGPPDYFQQHPGWSASLRRDPLNRLGRYLSKVVSKVRSRETGR